MFFNFFLVGTWSHLGSFYLFPWSVFVISVILMVLKFLSRATYSWWSYLLALAWSTIGLFLFLSHWRSTSFFALDHSFQTAPSLEFYSRKSFQPPNTYQSSLSLLVSESFHKIISNFLTVESELQKYLLIVYLGIFICTFMTAKAKSSADYSSSIASPQIVTGLIVLSVALFLSSFIGIIQEKTRFLFWIKIDSWVVLKFKSRSLNYFFI